MRKTGQRKTAIKGKEENGFTDEIDELDEKERGFSPIEEYSDTEGIMATVQGRVYSFLQRIDMEDSEPVYYLHKYDNYINGEQKSFLKKLVDCDPPDEEYIANVYGPGRYMLTLTLPQTKSNPKGYTRIYKFRIHPSFGQENNLKLPSIPQQLLIPGNKNGNGMNEAFSMIEKIFMLLTPIINKPRDENVMGILNQNYQSVNELMKKQMEDNLQVLTDYQRSIADLGESASMQPEIDNEVEEKPSIIEQFGPLIQQWIPVLLGGGPQAKAASAMVQTVPQVQQIMKDKIQLRRIINYLDKTNGVESTDKLLAALKIQRAGKRSVQIEQPAVVRVPAKQSSRKKAVR